MTEKIERKRCHTNETTETITKKKSFSTSLANEFQEIIRIVSFPTKMSGCEDSPNLDTLMDAHTHSLKLVHQTKINIRLQTVTRAHFISLLQLASDYVDPINKIVAVGANLLSPTHQNIALFCKLAGAMLWNGYREKHEAKFFLQGLDSTISAALTLEV